MGQQCKQSWAYDEHPAFRASSCSSLRIGIRPWIRTSCTCSFECQTWEPSFPRIELLWNCYVCRNIQLHVSVWDIDDQGKRTCFIGNMSSEWFHSQNSTNYGSACRRGRTLAYRINTLATKSATSLKSTFPSRGGCLNLQPTRVHLAPSSHSGTLSGMNSWRYAQASPRWHSCFSQCRQTMSFFSLGDYMWTLVAYFVRR